MRKVLVKIVFLVVLLMLMSVTGAKGVLAGPHFTLTPASGSFTVGGANFDVVLGVDSGTDKVVAMDAVATFDATKLEVVSIQKSPSAVFGFAFDANTAIIHNDTGRFEVTLSPSSSSVYDGVVVSGPLLVVTFRPKAVGVASVNMTCQVGSVTESNIINQLSADIVDCSANQSGSYTLVAGTGGSTSGVTSTVTPVPTATTSTTSTTSTTTELPRTGGVGSTVGLVVFGLMSVLGGLMLRWL